MTYVEQDTQLVERPEAADTMDLALAVLDEGKELVQPDYTEDAEEIEVQ